MTTAFYIAACLVVPFAWGVFIHWVFRRVERAVARRRGGRSEAPPPVRSPGNERSSAWWDYQI